jgi:hypothetical protein
VAARLRREGRGASLKALAIYAGPKARAHLRAQGLKPSDVGLVPAAAGGPKGLVLNPLDRFLFGHWWRDSTHPLHLAGASIGAWRMACACLPDAQAALAELAQDYIGQRYDAAPGRAPKPEHVSTVFGAKLQERLGRRASEVLAHPSRRLHVFTSRGRHVLRREHRFITALGYGAAFLGNSLHRRGLGLFMQRVVFSDARSALPLPLDDLPSARVALTSQNLAPAVLASCSIPFWLNAVHSIPGAPPGAYWDGGITDYHLHLPYAQLGGTAPLVLYPHFQPEVVPGWLDKAFKHRHRATPWLDNLVLLCPRPEWVAALPNAKLPDRSDFQRYAHDVPQRMRVWQQALGESERLAQEFAQWLERPDAEVLALR